MPLESSCRSVHRAEIDIIAPELSHVRLYGLMKLHELRIKDIDVLLYKSTCLREKSVFETVYYLSL
jgi:hypothetical protein